MFRKGKKRHSSSSSQSSEISTKSKSVDSSLGGLSRSSTVASLDTDSTKSSGQSNNSDTCAEFRIKYVGAIEKLKLSEGKCLEGPLDLINYIDVAQQDGKLPFVPLEEEFIMGVSKYGIKVSTSDQYDVLHRHALYLIIRMVCYDDGLGAGKSLLALKTTDASNQEYSLWVYQCNSLVRFSVSLVTHSSNQIIFEGRRDAVCHVV
ncbi:integrin beta-1-binding protein 1 isoform X1 [Ovis aries]|uniref:integrin beta-1-binding protein 1 isoform X1 n=1 Tax=Ovis aries TaxID=9940 RepID=UPI0003CCE9C4|nr:integrin beta-1-binding protein 1 isoform X1 [Ovis aries]